VLSCCFGDGFEDFHGVLPWSMGKVAGERSGHTVAGGSQRRLYSTASGARRLCVDVRNASTALEAVGGRSGCERDAISPATSVAVPGGTTCSSSACGEA